MRFTKTLPDSLARSLSLSISLWHTPSAIKHYKILYINMCGFVRGTHELISPAAGTTNKLGISCSDFCLTQTHTLGAAERNNSDCSAPLGFSACRSCRRKISGSFAFSQSRSASNHPILLALQCALGLQLLIGLRCFIPKKMVGKQRLFYLNLQASFRINRTKCDRRSGNTLDHGRLTEEAKEISRARTSSK